MPDHKKQALRLVAVATDKLNKATRERDAAMKFALESGASLREIADQAAISHQSVKNIVERS